MKITEELIRQIVIEVVDRIEGLKSQNPPSPGPVKKVWNSPFQLSGQEEFRGRVLTGTEVESAFRRGVQILQVSPKALLTPLAEERARDLGLTLSRA